MITLALRDVCLHAPKGRYVVTYDGDGEIDFGMDATPVAFQKGQYTPTKHTSSDTFSVVFLRFFGLRKYKKVIQESKKYIILLLIEIYHADVHA